MRPMFPFYGSKWRDAKRYGAPNGATVIEPFAGSAGYSTFFEPSRVILNDIDPIIVSVWRYLVSARAAEILALPDLKAGQTVDDLTLPQEAKWFIGFWLNRGSSQPKKSQTAFSARAAEAQLTWSSRARERVASQLELIRHWEIREGSYLDIPNLPAVWFIDPPYVDKGRYYRCSFVDYTALAAFSANRSGRVIVCEQDGASWLPFQPLANIKSLRGESKEVVWGRVTL